MPIYEYRCQGCGRTEEQRKSLEQRNEKIECRECGDNFTRAHAAPHTWGPTRGLQ